MDIAAPSWEHAEFDPPAAANQCARCRRSIDGAYFEAAGHLLCGSCREAIDAHWLGGSAPGRVLRAIAFGAGAAVLGATIYFALAALTGYEFGLVAILVGWLVGTAIRHATNHRGGRGYQWLAVVLTYAAIVSTYIPPIWRAIQSERPAALQQRGVASVEASSLPRVTWRLAATVVVLAWLAPFFLGWSNALGWIVIGIGLYQAWKLTSPTRFSCTGPYALLRAPPS